MTTTSAVYPYKSETKFELITEVRTDEQGRYSVEELEMNQHRYSNDSIGITIKVEAAGYHAEETNIYLGPEKTKVADIQKRSNTEAMPAVSSQRERTEESFGEPEVMTS